MFKSIYAGWLANAQSKDQSLEEYYTRVAFKILQEDGREDWAENLCYVPDVTVGPEPVYISGYSYIDIGCKKELILTVTIFDHPDEQKTDPGFLTKARTEEAFRHVRMFFQKIQKGIFDALNEGSSLYNLVAIVRNRLGYDFDISRDSLRIVLISGYHVKREYVPDSIELSKEGNSATCVYMDFDHVLKETSPSPEMDFSSCPEGGISYLQVRTNENVDFFDAYLLVVPGTVLADCYDRYTDSVLEKNVRGYLRATKTNKKIRSTISKEPDMFFLFNNGLTLTANEIEEENGKIVKLKGVQIVNGGQTTATIHEAWSHDKASVANVYIQAKLTIVPAAFSDGLVKDISICSNTQNAVTDVDLRRSDAIQRAFERYSRSVSAPNQTYWYYERVKKQRLNARTLKWTQGKRYVDNFDSKFPAKQAVNAEKLATAVMAFEGKPWLVSQGTTKVLNMADGFSAVMNKLLQDNPDFADRYPTLFKDCVAKYILYEKYLTPLVQKVVKSKYEGHTEASRMMLAYAVNTYVLCLAKIGKSIDFLRIWEKQEPSDKLVQSILTLAEKVIEISHDHPRTWFRSKENWSNYYAKFTRTLEYMRFDVEAPDIKNELPIKYSDQVRLKAAPVDEIARRVTMPAMNEYFGILKKYLRGRNVEQDANALLDKRLQNCDGLSVKDCKRLYNFAERQENDNTELKQMLPFSIVEARTQRAKLWEEVGGDSVELFLAQPSDSVYVCFCSLENTEDNICLQRLFRMYPEFKSAYDSAEKKTELGEIFRYELSASKAVVLMYTERTPDSVPYHRIYEACFRKLSALYPAPISHVFMIECSGLYARLSIRLRELINMFSNEIDYAHAKWIIAP